MKMHELKIGFVFDDSLDKTDGVQQYVLSLGTWFSEQGHEVHYLVGQTRRQDIPHIHSLSRNLQVHFNQNRMSTPLPADRAQIKELLSREQFDVLHVQLPYSPFLAGRVIRAASKRTVILGTFHIIPFSLLERLATKLLGVWCWRTLRRFDGFYSVSQPAQKFLKQSFRKKSSIVPNPVNLRYFQAGRKLKKYDDDKINIVFLGRLVERKGCQLLLQALAELHRKRQLDRVRVLICGKGPLEASLHDYVKKERLGQIVHFVGYIPEEQKRDYLATADIAVLPSTGGESFGIVLTEAMAAGADIVLAGNNVGYRSVMGGKSEQLVNPSDTHEFARRLRHFILSSHSRRQAKRWQEQHVKQFDVELIGVKLLQDYSERIAKKLKADNNEGQL